MQNLKIKANVKKYLILFCFVFAVLFNLACSTETTNMVFNWEEREKKKTFYQISRFEEKFRQPQIYVVVDKM